MCKVREGEEIARREESGKREHWTLISGHLKRQSAAVKGWIELHSFPDLNTVLFPILTIDLRIVSC